MINTHTQRGQLLREYIGRLKPYSTYFLTLINVTLINNYSRNIIINVIMKAIANLRSTPSKPNSMDSICTKNAWNRDKVIIIEQKDSNRKRTKSTSNPNVPSKGKSRKWKTPDWRKEMKGNQILFTLRYILFFLNVVHQSGVSDNIFWQKWAWNKLLLYQYPKYN